MVEVDALFVLAEEAIGVLLGKTSSELFDVGLQIGEIEGSPHPCVVGSLEWLDLAEGSFTYSRLYLPSTGRDWQ